MEFRVLMSVPFVLLWAFAGLCLGFEDVRDWLLFTAFAAGSGWATSYGLHRTRR